MIKKAKLPVIQFHFLERNFAFSKRTLLKAFISKLFLLEKTDLESLSIIFCSDEYLLQINTSFLNHSYYTDIITFNLADGDSPVTGELYISIERVRENAETQQVPFSNELKRVIFHGCLHLCGFKDKSKTDIKLMRDMEDFYLDLLSKELR